MKTNIARQPILNERNDTVAYKLLFRGYDTTKNKAIFHDGSEATTEVIKNWLINFGLDQLTNDKRAFINFTETLLLEKMPRLLRKDSFTIELEKNINLSKSVIESIIELESEGYVFAFTLEQLKKTPDENKNLIEILKFDFLKYTNEEISQFMNTFKEDDYIFLAEKIETQETYHFAKALGFQLFQGYYFETPTILETTAISTIPTVYYQLLEALDDENTNSEKLAEITKQDVSLTYTVLNIVNSIAHYSRQRIKSLKDAYTRLGTKESKRIIYYNFLKSITPNETPSELIKKSLIRGKHAELLSTTFKLNDKKEELFLLGLLSLMNIILKDDMNKIIKRIHLSKEIGDALLGDKNELSNVIDLIILYERNYEELFLKKINEHAIDLDVFTKTYIKAVQWSDAIFQ